MSVTYPQYPSSVFPEGTDNITPARDIEASDVDHIQEYQDALLNGAPSTTLAQILADYVLTDKIINASRWNQIRDSLLAMEQYCQDGITAQYGQFGFKGTWSSSTVYKKNNIIVYRPANIAVRLYISISDGDNLNHIPSAAESSSYWKELTIAGGGDYARWRGDWSPSPDITYNQNDLVTYTGPNSRAQLYIAGGSIVPTVPPTTPGSNWELLIKSAEPIPYTLSASSPSTTPEVGTVYFQTVDYS